MNDCDTDFILCLKCFNVVKTPVASTQCYCPRCYAKLFKRKKKSISNTLALLIAALLFYIPANIFPIMTVKSFGQVNSNTIIGGVIALYNAKMYFISAIVFFASIFIPIFKITTLFYLIFSLKSKKSLDNTKKTKLFHFVDKIGKWSMLDIYVIAILVAVVKMNFIAEIYVEFGAILFAAVVLLTMFAAKTFDIRLIWNV